MCSSDLLTSDPHSRPRKKKRTYTAPPPPRPPPRAAASLSAGTRLLISPPGAVHRFRRPALRLGLGWPKAPTHGSRPRPLDRAGRPASPVFSARISCCAAAPSTRRSPQLALRDPNPEAGSKIRRRATPDRLLSTATSGDSV